MIPVKQHYTDSSTSAVRDHGYSARMVSLGGASLLAGAGLVDAGRLVGSPAVGRLGCALTAIAGLGLVWLPSALRAWGALVRSRWSMVGAVAYFAGIAVASAVDVPSVVDPGDTRLGAALGAPALVLASIGLLVIRWSVDGPQLRRLLLLAGIWFFVQMPLNLARFIVPTGEPSFLLLAGGVAVALAAVGLRLSRVPENRPT